MKIDEVILGGAAKAFAKRIGVPEEDIKLARVGATSNLGGNEFLILVGTLPDGRSVRLRCRHDIPAYIVSFRPL